MKNKRVKIDSVDKMIAEMIADRKAHPIYYFFFDLYNRVKNFITDIPMNVKIFIQRGKRGWSVRDVWGYDFYLAKIISEGLKHLKENGKGIPTYKKGKSDEKAIKEWKNILDTIIKTFETAMKIANGDYHYIPSKKFLWKDYKSMIKICADINKKYPNDLPKQKAMTKRESLEYEKGFNLFKEWFFALWD